MHDEKDLEFTGFPSIAGDYRKPSLNLHTLLVRNPISTFFAIFHGDAMIGEHIFDRDLLVIERSTQYGEGNIVLAFVDGQRIVRKLEKEEGQWILAPANERYRRIRMTEEMQIFGRVIHSITHHLRVLQHLPVAN